MNCIRLFLAPKNIIGKVSVVDNVNVKFKMIYIALPI
jgi:hypothetical protein